MHGDSSNTIMLRRYGAKAIGIPAVGRPEYDLSTTGQTAPAGVPTLERHLNAVVAAIHRRLLRPAKEIRGIWRTTSAGFRIYSRHRMRVIPAVPRLDQKDNNEGW